MSRRRFNRTKISSHHPARRYKKRRFFGFFLKSTLAAALLVLFFILGLFIYFAKDLPSPENISARLITQSTKIFDRTGETLLYDIHGEEKRTVIPLSEIPRPMQFATIAIEDHLFYEHHGIYFRGIVRAFIANFTGRHIAQGGSTITQQYIKNSFLTPERTYPRKIKEAILALELEIKYSKDEILTFYLNEIPYGSNAYGVEAAAQTFFGKSARDLTLAESALLAALPQATSYYSPYGNHPEELSNRQHTILRRMRDLDFITENEMNAAIEEKLVFSRSPQRIIAPHFMMMIREELNNTYGEDYIERSGLKVYTTLDMHLQHTAEEAVNVNFESLSEKYNTGNVALAATDPKSGEILALVGSHDTLTLKTMGM